MFAVMRISELTMESLSFEMVGLNDRDWSIAPSIQVV